MLEQEINCGNFSKKEKKRKEKKERQKEKFCLSWEGRQLGH